MSRKKIKNWREIIPLMVDHYYLYNEMEHKITGYQFFEDGERLEIKTDIRPYFFPYAAIEKTVLYDWKPINYNNVPKFNHFDLIKFYEEDTGTNLYVERNSQNKDNTTNVPATTADESNPYKQLKEEGALLYQKHKTVLGTVNEKLLDLMKDLGTNKIGPNTRQDIKLAAEISKQIVNNAAQELRDFMTVKNIMMPNGKILGNDGQELKNEEEKNKDKKE